MIFYPHIIEYGGIERNVVGLAEAVLAHGFRPLVLCFYDKVGLGTYVPGLQVVALGEALSRPQRLRALRAWFHAPGRGLRGRPFFFGARAGHYAGLVGISGYVLHYTDPPSLLSAPQARGWVRGLLDAPRHWAAEYAMRRGIRQAERCLTMTQANAHELQALYQQPFGVVYQGGLAPPATAQGDAARARCQGNEVVVFSLCRLNASKHLDWILHAAAQWQRGPGQAAGAPRLKIVLAGQGPEEAALRQLAERLGLGAQTEFPGFLSQEQVEPCYARADIVAVPGRQGYGLPVLEALYRGIPVVMSRESRVSEILEDHPLVALCSHTAEAFAAAFERHLHAMQQPDAAVPVDAAALPTEAGWGHDIGVHCQWWPAAATAAR